MPSTKSYRRYSLVDCDEIWALDMARFVLLSTTKSTPSPTPLGFDDFRRERLFRTIDYMRRRCTQRHNGRPVCFGGDGHASSCTAKSKASSCRDIKETSGSARRHIGMTRIGQRISTPPTQDSGLAASGLSIKHHRRAIIITARRLWVRLFALSPKPDAFSPGRCPTAAHDATNERFAEHRANDYRAMPRAAKANAAPLCPMISRIRQ